MLIITIQSVVALSIPLRAQDDPGSASIEAEINPESISPFQSRHYKVRQKKLWNGVLQALEENGHPPEEIDAKKRIVKTSFVDFEAKNYPGDVALPPPPFGPKNPVMQRRSARFGKVSIEARVSKDDSGTELKIRARILVEGIDRQRRLRVLVDRRSSGVIESDFFEKIESVLGIEPI